MKLIAFDIGGTMTKMGLYESDVDQDILIEHDVFPSQAEQGGEALQARLMTVIAEVKKRFPFEGIAISSAGQINPLTGEVVYATDNIPGYTGMNLRVAFEERFQVPVSVENDVNCFLLGECASRALKGDVLGLAIGTGIGGAIYSNSQMIRGSSFSAGEIGHLQLVPHGKPCTCGFSGCFEQYASTKALKELISSEIDSVNLIHFFEKCKQNEASSLIILDRWIDDLTDGLKSLVHILNPETIVIGGAIAAQGKYLEDLIEIKLKAKIMPSYARHLRVIVSDQGNSSNLIGALIHYKASHTI